MPGGGGVKKHCPAQNCQDLHLRLIPIGGSAGETKFIRPTLFGRHRGKVMKKILLSLTLGFVLFPLVAMAQKWVEPYTQRDGTQVEGHWETPQDSWQKNFSQPGTVNPMTGQFNTYDKRVPGSSPQPDTNASSSYAIPGSSPNPNAPNPYAIPGSSPNPDSSNQRR